MQDFVLPAPVTWQLAVGVTVASYITYRGFLLLKFFIKPHFSLMRSIPGPAVPPGPKIGFFRLPSLILGNLDQIRSVDPGDMHEEWIAEYGHVLVFKFLFGMDRLLVTDIKAVNHVLSHSFRYTKPQEIRYALGSLLGDGILFAEGQEHKRQRKIMNPSFSNNHIRDLTEIFLEKSIELRDSIATTYSQYESAVIQPHPQVKVQVDVLNLLSRTTLDIIGLAGFNYPFDSLKDGEEANELSRAFGGVFKSTGGFPLLGILKAFIPILRIITFDQRSRAQAQAEESLRRIGRNLVASKKQAVLEEKARGGTNARAKDLLSLLIEANLNAETGQGLSDEDVQGQIPTFVVAGHETTATSTTWGLFALSTHPEIQRKLREELILSGLTDKPTMDELNSLPYLDAVVRETLRVFAPVTAGVGVAAEDDVIPLEKPFVDRKGVTRAEIIIKKGDVVLIPLLIMNRMESIWGADAKAFKPERWFNLPPEVNAIPGAWGNQMTFLAGPRACIGLKFAVVEMKALLFTLIRGFEFEPAFDPKDIIKKATIVTRPSIRSAPEKGDQMPLFVRPVQAGVI